MVDIP
jgi:hypothetical protein